MIYYTSGQLEEAKDNFLKSIASTPSYYPGHINLGDVYLLDQDWDKARYHYQKAQELAGELENISESISRLINYQPINYKRIYILVITIIRKKAREPSSIMKRLYNQRKNKVLNFI
jgi:tetratricopeptide (TPR) repeat protein